ncbi:hypothetical protein [Vannielia litorea]|uniref:hypothetical protein n=1 Tax=Vannielia litorea TaxID=1217970 RepID=UPI001BD0BBB1|nr:hypothetical protein [Vannielia litorea]MBS8225832.1 hypothetical protein [Vannielia litorea]
MTKIDRSKLLGFKLDSAVNEGAKMGAKDGVKMGNKVGLKAGAKVGLKMGDKAVAPTRRA